MDKFDKLQLKLTCKYPTNTTRELPALYLLHLRLLHSSPVLFPVASDSTQPVPLCFQSHRRRRAPPQRRLRHLQPFRHPRETSPGRHHSRSLPEEGRGGGLPPRDHVLSRHLEAIAYLRIKGDQQITERKRKKTICQFLTSRFAASSVAALLSKPLLLPPRRRTLSSWALLRSPLLPQFFSSK